MRIGPKITVEDYFRSNFGKMLVNEEISQEDYDEKMEQINAFLKKSGGEIHEYFISTRYKSSSGLCTIDASGNVLATFEAKTS